MNDDTKNKPPYIGYGTFKNFLSSLKELVPARIDSTTPFMVGQSGSAQSFLMSALRFFGLVDGKVPTVALKSLAQAPDEDARRVVWNELFTKAYAPITDGLDLTTATAGMLHEKFREQGLNGETINKCFSFFVLGAGDAGVPLAKHLAPGTRTGSSGPRKARKSRPAGNGGSTFEAPPPPPPISPKQDMKELLLAKFPQFDPAWPDELKAKWFDGYERLLKTATDEGK